MFLSLRTQHTYRFSIPNAPVCPCPLCRRLQEDMRQVLLVHYDEQEESTQPAVRARRGAEGHAGRQAAPLNPVAARPAGC